MRYVMLLLLLLGCCSKPPPEPQVYRGEDGVCRSSATGSEVDESHCKLKEAMK